MPIDWKSQESYQRLLGALVAASDHNIDYRKVAYFFGQGATYDAIEGRFRIAKKTAEALQHEATSSGRAMPTSTRRKSVTTPRKPRAPKTLVDSQDGVIGGRVSKPASPRKKKPAATEKAIKNEPQTPTSLDDDAAVGQSSFDFEAGALADMNLDASFGAVEDDWMHAGAI
ncbi:hypothetical protein K490DRAFT_65374 [Saccharata proteae CBS 121410]|uniref:Uncharacterized protein n=1 Tax=Saccharata proteae CBS 121410 TaxID=1314787 RepID=A0A9P4HWY5_9PEZI|nr:hypothetical protein K490DRAFT_65374 [Saccharata proteae CBS 121410]